MAVSNSQMTRKCALIAGITGQDGSYFAELLLSKGYEVHGIIRPSSSLKRQRIDPLPHDSPDGSSKVRLHYGHRADSSSLNRILRSVRPDEIYHLGALSHVKVSSDMPKSFVRGVIQLPFEGGVDEKGHNIASGKLRVAVDPRYFRPTEVDLLLGDAAKARQRLGWQPKVGFEALVNMMTDADLEFGRRERDAALARV